jgi:hypothetical protein
VLGRTWTFSQIADAISTADLRFSPISGTIPQRVETMLSASKAASKAPMFTRVRFERSTGGWRGMRKEQDEESARSEVPDVVPHFLLGVVRLFFFIDHVSTAFLHTPSQRLHTL